MRSHLARGLGIAALCGGLTPAWAMSQDPAPSLDAPTLSASSAPAGVAADPAPETTLEPIPQYNPNVAPTDHADGVRPTTEGPLHEAFLSPAKDAATVYADKAPPSPINERPGVDPPSDQAVWIPGYWEWNPGSKEYAWATGTYRVPPPGRFWVNGYWKRDEKGWFRVAGFWSDRQTDRLDWRKNGPPTDRPDEDVAASPGADYFYIPGHYAPDGDGVAWKKGFWSKTQPGWSWVPAQWLHQPEGWTFQEGYWDRALEDRGTLFAPAEGGAAPDPNANNAEITYSPVTQIAPEQYGQLYGAFGRPNSYYDGYPGCFYDASGRYYGYANYGSIGSYYGYLDYPYTGSYGYPYLAQPVAYGNYGYGGSGGGYGGYGGYGNSGGYGLGGYGLGGGFLGGLFANSYLGATFGSPYYGYGLGYYPGYYGGSYLGYGGLGGYGLGFGGLGYGLGGYGLGFGGLGLGLAFNNFGYGYGGSGRGGYGYNSYNRGFNQGFRQGFVDGRHGIYPNAPHGYHNGGATPNRGGIGRNSNFANHAGGGVNPSFHRGGATQANFTSHVGRPGAALAPASSHAYANPFNHGGATPVNRSVGGAGNRWASNYNGAHQAAQTHSVARPSFASNAATLNTLRGAGPGGNLNHPNHAGPTGGQHLGANAGNGLNHPGAGPNGLGGNHLGNNNFAAPRGNIGAPGGGVNHANGMGGVLAHAGGNPAIGHLGNPGALGGNANHFAAPHAGGSPGGNVNHFAAPRVGGGNAGFAPRAAGGYGGLGAAGLGGPGAGHVGGYAGGGHPGAGFAPSHAGGFNGGHVGGYAGGGHMGGGFAPSHAGGFNGGHVGGYAGGGHMGGGHVGGFSGGGHAGGGGGHGGGHH